MKSGDKILLRGGGGVANHFTVVRLIEIKESDRPNIAEKQAVLETDCRLPNPFTPYLKSWYLTELPEELKDLPLGSYLICGKNIIDDTTIGIFGTIYDGKIVKTLE